MTRLATLALAASLAAACHAPRGAFPEGRVVDLTHVFDADTVYWPTASGFTLHVDAQGWTEKGYWYEANSFESAEHGGTHLDAPIHFAEGRRAVDEIPVEQLMGPGVVVDVRTACAADRDHRVTVAELEAWEAEHGTIPEGAIVLLDTGFARFWPDRERYMGTAERGAGAVPLLHFPGLSEEAARWIVERPIAAVGLDTPSIDCGQSQFFEAHRVLFEADVPALENVANLDQLPPRDFHVIALPMKIGAGSGAPTRIVAIVPED